MAEELCCIPVLIKYPKSRLAKLGSHFCCASDLFSHACFEVSRAQDVMGCRQVRAGVGACGCLRVQAGEERQAEQHWEKPRSPTDVR